MIETGELSRGVTIELDGILYQVLDVKHIKVGRGSAQVRLKLRNVLEGHIVEKTVQAGERFPRATLEKRNVQYLYNEGDLYYMMDTTTYDQFPMSKDQLEDAIPYLTDNMVLDLVFYQDEPIGVEMATTVEMTVVEAPPAFKGDTAASNNKPVKTNSGLMVNVPYFVAEGDKIIVDTRTGTYVSRA